MMLEISPNLLKTMIIDPRTLAKPSRMNAKKITRKRVIIKLLKSKNNKKKNSQEKNHNYRLK